MLTAFTAGLLLITVSELGDKTFFITTLLAMRHSRRLVFVGAVAALAAMTVLSVLMGQVATLLPAKLVHWTEVALFIGFGLKLLYNANQMSSAPPDNEVEEAKEAIDDASPKLAHWRDGWGIVAQSFGLTFMAEWGDRTQFTTVALSAGNHPLGVTVGAIAGHAVCAAIAVLGGCFVARRISERAITALGGALFLLFGIVAAAGR
ncbi:MAG: TMEM165/GDT1 family protein [Leptolyngbyaceae cyanobacterium HOT.MB2.61]|nr:TMEM165/GDT1 family protein [Leptolyngbyaceae cyanobacterium HOT.MB2.61]